MKKLLFGTLLLFVLLPLSAQNIQFITDGKKSIATFEIYKTLEHGALYYFTDFKMNKNGFDEAYSEISKYWSIGKSTWSLTAQYNAGLSFNKDSVSPVNGTHHSVGFHIYPVYLGGISKAFSIGKNFNISVDLLYRHQNFLYLSNKERHDGVQTTIVFSENLDKISISGYADIWLNQDGLYYIFEPQAWYKFSKRIYAGLEWRNSNYGDVLNTDINGDHTANYANYLMVGFKWNLE
jgi:hypothetical protein